MANTDIASTLVQFLAANPQLITQFLNHPYSTTQRSQSPAHHAVPEPPLQHYTAGYRL